MAALIAPTRSSSSSAGIWAAIISPSVEITPDASMSAEVPLSSFKIELSISARMGLLLSPLFSFRIGGVKFRQIVKV
jgi:hypothetical protein